jgi:hypothetical protein
MMEWDTIRPGEPFCTILPQEELTKELCSIKHRSARGPRDRTVV